MLKTEFDVINDKLDAIAKALRFDGMEQSEYDRVMLLNKKRDELFYAEETCEG